MNYLTVFVFISSIMAFAAMLRGAWLHSQLRVLRNYNDDGTNDLRIELVKKKARFAHLAAVGLCLTSGFACYAIQSQKLSMMFAVFCLISGLSVWMHRAEKEERVKNIAVALPAAMPLIDQKKRDEADDLFNTETSFAAFKQTDDVPQNEDEQFTDVLKCHHQIQIEHEREKRRNQEEKDDWILDSDLLH